MNHNKLKEIREACIKANPEKEWVETYVAGEEEYSDDVPVHLADVLLAIEETELWEIQSKWAYKLIWAWNKKDDNLEHQSEETISFIHSLLT